VGRRVEEAGRLWREGFFCYSIVSGGVTPGSSRSECEIIKEAMVADGIPSEVILEEHRATNTGENVIFSLPIIEAALGLKNIRSVICLGNTWTATPLSNDTAPLLAGSRKDAGDGRYIQYSAFALAHAS
jgi:uncharacterized SAM-binding protein YcdF (DUF218 family)